MAAENKPGDNSVITRFFAHNIWANLKILDFCEQLSDEQLDASAIGVYGTIRDTLRHMFGAEVSYVWRVNGRHPEWPGGRENFPGFAALKNIAAWTNNELLQLALATGENSMVRESEGQESVEYTLASLMVQVINHATDHRAQIATIITQLGMEPPNMDVWNYMEESGEFRIFKTGA